MVLIDIERAFHSNGEDLCLPTTEVLLCIAVGKLVKLKKLQNWTSRNTVLLLPFLTEIALTDRETAAEALLKIFAKRINDQEAENTAKDSDAEEEIRSVKDNEKEKEKTRSMKDATSRDAMDRIATDFNIILPFLQAVVPKAPRVQAA